MKRLLLCMFMALLSLGMSEPPEHLNTKQDYINLVKSHPEYVKKKLDELKKSRFIWQIDKELTDKSKGEEDANNRVVESENENHEKVILQLKKIEDINSRMKKIGFTLKEIENMEKEVDRIIELKVKIEELKNIK